MAKQPYSFRLEDDMIKKMDEIIIMKRQMLEREFNFESNLTRTSLIESLVDSDYISTLIQYHDLDPEDESIMFISTEPGQIRKVKYGFSRDF